MKRFWMAVLAGVLAFTLAACGGQGSVMGGGEPAPPPNDAVKIDQIDWEVKESVVNGSRQVSLSYTNNSAYTIVYLGIEFTQREDVTDEQRSVFDEVYSNPDYEPAAERDELYAVGSNEHYVAPGASADPQSCSLAYAITALTMDQLELMEPNIAQINFVGEDGEIYTEYYDFLNDEYSLDEWGYEVVDEWPDAELAQMIPSIEATTVEIRENEEDVFKCREYGATQEDYDSYVDLCKDKGFDIVDTEYDSWYVATNEEGYEIDVNYYESSDSLYVEITAPEE